MVVGVKEAFDLHAVLCPLFDLVEIAVDRAAQMKETLTAVTILMRRNAIRSSGLWT
jgi:hypothetical protein